MRQAGLFGLSDHLKRLSAYCDPLEELGRIIDFEAFRPVLVAALAYGDGTKGGRPPYDPVAMLKALVLAAQNNVSAARMEYLIRDRLSWLRVRGFDLGAPTPGANPPWRKHDVGGRLHNQSPGSLNKSESLRARHKKCPSGNISK